MAFWNDVQKNIGNFGRSVSRNVNDFFVDTEEEKRRRRQQAAQKPTAAPRPQVRYQQSNPLGVPQPGAPNPLSLNKPNVTNSNQLKVPKPNAKVDQTGKPTEVKTIDTGTILDKATKEKMIAQFRAVKSGAANVKTDALTPEQIVAAKREGKTERDKLARDSNMAIVVPTEVAKATGQVGQWLTRELLARPAATLIRSAQEGIVGKDQSEDRVKRNKNAISDFLLGDAPIKTIQRQGAEGSSYLKKEFGVSEGTATAGGVALGTALVALDTPFGKPVKAAFKGLKAGKQLTEQKLDEALTAVVDKVRRDAEQRAGRSLVKEEVEQIAKEAERQAVSELPGSGGINPERDARIAERNAAEQVVEEVPTNEPAFVRKRREAEDAQRAALEPTRETPREKTALEIKNEKIQAINDADVRLNEAVNSNPMITEAEQLALRDGVKAELDKTLKSIDDSQIVVRAALEKEIDDNAARIAGTQDEAAVLAQKQADEIAPAIETTAPQGGSTTPPEGPPPDAPAPTPEAPAPLPEETQRGMSEGYRADTAQTAMVENATTNVRGPQRELNFRQALSKKITGNTYKGLGEMYKDLVDKGRDATSDLLYKGVQSNNAITSSLVKAPRAIFANLGVKDTDRLIANQLEARMAATKTLVKNQRRELQDMFKATGNPELTSQRMYQVFEEPEMLARMYGDGTPKLSPDDLTDLERPIFDRLVTLNKERNNLQLAAGRITPEQHALYADGMHSPRIYDLSGEVDQSLDIAVKGRNANAKSGVQRKDVSELPQDVIDRINANPADSMLIRLQSALDDASRKDVVRDLTTAGKVFDKPPMRNGVPVKGWSRLEGPEYGNYQGQWVDNQLLSVLENRQVFSGDMGKRTNDLLDVYRGSFMGTLDRTIKKTKTVYSPATFIGNVASNPFFFNRGAGVNALGQAYNMTREAPSVYRHVQGIEVDPIILRMQQQGIKIGDTGAGLTGSSQSFQVFDEGGAMKTIKDVANIPQGMYAGADDVAKVAIFKQMLRKGLDDNEAAKRVANFTQDYGNAGRMVQMFADSPILGSPFARFAPELVRIAKNNALYNPVGVVGGLFALAAVQNKLQGMSGETDEERALREGGLGKTKIPWTGWINEMAGGKGDISLDFPTPKDTPIVGEAAINAARALGLNFPIDPSGDPYMSLLRNLVPFAVPLREDSRGDQVLDPAQIVSSMTLKQLADLAMNRDFMGRMITDPTNKVRDEYAGTNDGKETKYSDDLTPEQQNKNRLYSLFMNWAPLASETDAALAQSGLRDKLLGTRIAEPEDANRDYYGKARTPAQAIGRAFGLKIEKNDNQAQKDRAEMSRYFDEDLPRTQEFLKANPQVADAYWSIKSSSVDRPTGEKDNDILPLEKWKIIQSDKTGALQKFFKEQEFRLHEKSIQDHNADPSKPVRPIHPMYQLDDEKLKQIIDLESKPTGDKETAQILRAEQPWYNEYETAKDAYHEEMKLVESTYDGPVNSRQVAYFDIKYPEQPPLLKEYYNIKNTQGDDAAKAYSDRQGDAMDDAFAQDKAATLAYTNAKRAIEGYPPISEEVWNNKTYGYKKDKDGGGYGNGSGSGRRRGGGGGGRETRNDMNILTALSAPTVGNIPLPDANIPEIRLALEQYAARVGGRRASVKLGASSRGQG